ncbi:MAG: peptide-methionine (R)-S-oxide reductase MsrB [Patescibacteria group bacterium]
MRLDDDELKQRLTSEQYRVLRQSATEPAFSGEYVNNHEDGSYVCGACGETLFMSDHKFDSNSGWPSFNDVAKQGAVKLSDDNSHGMNRVEVRCSNCDSHLGHLFEDAVGQPTNQRFCINSCALNFNKQEKK